MLAAQQSWILFNPDGSSRRVIVAKYPHYGFSTNDSKFYDAQCILDSCAGIFVRLFISAARNDQKPYWKGAEETQWNQQRSKIRMTHKA